jgi:hypothetical protein
MPYFRAVLPNMVKNAILHKPMVLRLHLLKDCVVGPMSARVTVELREPVGAGQYVRCPKCTPRSTSMCGAPVVAVASNASLLSPKTTSLIIFYIVSSYTR